MKRLSLGALLMVAFAVAITASPKNSTGVTYTFLQLEPAGDPASPHYPVSRGTSATGINNLNQIVGHDNGYNGVFYSPSGGVLSTFRGIDISPGPPIVVSPARVTITHKINDHGTVIGLKGASPTSTAEAFVRSADGTFTRIIAPNGEFAELVSGLAINNHGDMVGEVWPGGVSWLLSGGTATLINTALTDINDFGHHVGRYGGGGGHGYLQTGPTMSDVTNIDHPLAGPGQTYPMGLNNRGQVVGYYYNTTDVYPVFQNGFLWEAGVFTPMDYQGLNQAGFSGRNTVPNDINDAGWVVGGTGETSTDPSFLGGGHAWLAIPDSPGAEASNPIIPDAVGANGVTTFTHVGTGQWFDPPASVAGYTYTMTGGELFTGILGFPSGFVTNVSTGTVLDNGTVSLGSGVSSFTVTFSPTVELGDTDAFPLQLSFSAPTASFTVTPVRQDTTAPVLTVSGNLTAEATGASGAIVTFLPPTATDDSGIQSVSCDRSSGETFVIGVTTVQCSATDTAGNVANKSFTVTVQDTTPPSLTLPSGLVTDATSPAGATVVFTVSATDIVDGARPVDCTPASGVVFVIGLTTVSCTTVDTRGNASPGGFTVTVRSAAQIVADLAAQSASADFQAGSNLLQNVLTSIGSGNTGAPCQQLSAFINQAQAQTGKKLAIAQAEGLIAAANKAKAALGCS